MRTHCISFVLTLVFSLPIIQAKEYLHPQLKSKEKIINTIGLLPPKVEVTKTGMKGGEGMVEESDKVANELAKIVSRVLAQKGFKVSEQLLSKEGLAGGNELRYAIADIQTRYDTMAAQMQKKPKDVTKGRFSMGDEIAGLNGGTTPDVWVFIRSYGTMLTGGKKAFGWLVAGAKNHQIVSYISLVDAQNGNVLFLSVIGAAGNFVEDPEKVLTKKVSKSLAKLAK